MKSLKSLVLVAFSAISLGLIHPNPIKNLPFHTQLLTDLAQIVKIYNSPPTPEIFGYNNEVYRGYKYELKTRFGSFLYIDMASEGLGDVGSNDGFGLNFSGREYGFIGFDGPEDSVRNRMFWDDLEIFRQKLKK